MNARSVELSSCIRSLFLVWIVNDLRDMLACILH